MHQPRSRVLWVFWAITLCAQFHFPGAWAQSYPTKPIRLVVGFAPGGSTDVVARLVGQKLSDLLGQPVVIENRAGAAGSIATEAVAKSPADGYTLQMIAAGDAVQPALRAKLPYDLVRNFAPVSQVVAGLMVLVVHPSFPVDSVPKLMAYARAQPGKLSYASDGIGGSLHLAGELFKMMANLNIVHVPYKGGSEAALAVATGQLEMGFPSITAALPLLATHKLRALGVSSTRRASSLPAVATLNEAGLPGYDFSSWQGVVGPAGMPGEIIAQLNLAIGKAVNTTEMKEALSKQGREAETGTPEQFGTLIRNEIAKNIKLVKFMGLKVE